MKKYYITLIAQDGNVFDEMKTDTLDDIKEWSEGRGEYYDNFTGTHKKYTVDIAKWSDDLDCYVPFKDYKAS